MREQINKKTSISLQLVIIIASIAFTSGILWMKIEFMDTRIAQLELKVNEIHGFLTPTVALNK